MTYSPRIQNSSYDFTLNLASLINYPDAEREISITLSDIADGKDPAPFSQHDVCKTQMFVNYWMLMPGTIIYGKALLGDFAINEIREPQEGEAADAIF